MMSVVHFCIGFIVVSFASFIVVGLVVVVSNVVLYVT